MGLLDRLFGGDDAHPERTGGVRQPGSSQSPDRLSDEQAIARYRYLVQTAPPDAIEQAHEEAFARLTPEQRRQVLEELSRTAAGYERPADVATRDDPRSLARMATRAELREPGTLERLFGARGAGCGGPGFGSMLGGGFFGSIAGMVVGSMIAESFLGSPSESGQPVAGDHDAPGTADTADDHVSADGGEADDVSADLSDDLGAELGDAGGSFGDDLL